jgi:hypothetical protein
MTVWYANRPLVVHREDSIFGELTVDEWEESGLMGVRRAAQSERANLHLKYGSVRDMFHELSSMHAERAAHIVLGGEWHQYDRDRDTKIRNVKGPDVAEYQIRQAAGGKNRSLIIRAGDKEEELFILVLGWHRLYEITGWMKASDAKQPRYHCSPDPGRPAAWMVPPEHLRPIRDLPGIDRNVADRFVSKDAHGLVRRACPQRKEDAVA